MDQKDIRDIQELINYRFRNPMLLQQAFIRRSYTQEHRDHQNNQVLEFIGDQVLANAVVKRLVTAYGEMTDDQEFASRIGEGKLTEIKAKLVEKKMLAHRIDLLGLQDYLIMGKGDRQNNAQEEDSVKEDLFEAILGAVAIDSDWDDDAINQVLSVLHAIDDYLVCGFGPNSVNYVELVQEWYQKNGYGLPEYQGPFVRGIGFVMSDSTYTCTLTLPRINGYYGQRIEGQGKNKASARMNCAKAVYSYLEQNNLLRTMEDEIDEPSVEMAINQLQELSHKGYFSMPEYAFMQMYDENGNPVWECTCSIEGYDRWFCSTRSSKKEAKKNAAYHMLLYVLDWDDPDVSYEADEDDDDWYDDD